MTTLWRHFQKTGYEQCTSHIAGSRGSHVVTHTNTYLRMTSFNVSFVINKLLSAYPKIAVNRPISVNFRDPSQSTLGKNAQIVRFSISLVNCDSQSQIKFANPRLVRSCINCDFRVYSISVEGLICCVQLGWYCEPSVYVTIPDVHWLVTHGQRCETDIYMSVT